LAGGSCTETDMVSEALLLQLGQGGEAALLNGSAFRSGESVQPEIHDWSASTLRLRRLSCTASIISCRERA
jgi:hypothetical protein